MTVYREHFTDENELATGPEGWIYAGTDDEFGILDRWMVPITEELYRWANQDGGPWVDTEDMRQELIDDGILIPEEGGSESQPPEKGTPPTP